MHIQYGSSPKFPLLLCLQILVSLSLTAIGTVTSHAGALIGASHNQASFNRLVLIASFPGMMLKEQICSSINTKVIVTPEASIWATLLHQFHYQECSCHLKTVASFLPAGGAQSTWPGGPKVALCFQHLSVSPHLSHANIMNYVM